MTQITTGPDGKTLFDGMTGKALADELHQMASRFADHGFSGSSYMTMEAAAAALRHLSARDEWQPIETLPERTNAEVGRWNGSGNGKFYWSSVSASWFTVNGAKEWTYERSYRKSPFYDDDGDYAEPTHFMLRPSPPPPPKGTAT